MRLGWDVCGHVGGKVQVPKYVDLIGPPAFNHYCNTQLFHMQQRRRALHTCALHCLQYKPSWKLIPNVSENRCTLPGLAPHAARLRALTEGSFHSFAFCEGWYCNIVRSALLFTTSLVASRYCMNLAAESTSFAN